MLPSYLGPVRATHHLPLIEHLDSAEYSQMALTLLLEHEDEGGEHDGAHPQQQEQQPQLLVVGLHGVAQRLEAGGMFC